MQLDRKKKLIISGVAVILLLILGSIVYGNTKNTQEGEKVEAKDEGRSSATTRVFEKELVDGKYFVVKSRLTWKQLGEKLAEGDENVLSSFGKVFDDLEWNGVFFECRPFKPSTAAKETVEFRLIRTEAFAAKTKDHSSFDAHFAEQCPGDGSEGAAVFANLDKSSRLVSPCPVDGLDGRHFKVFMSTATSGQRRVLLGAVGRELLDRIGKGGDGGIWLSTSGLAVSWLHVRFDPSAKYYTTSEYKTI